MKSSHPQLEFIDLLAEVSDSTQAMCSGKGESTPSLDWLRREEARAESELRLAWADWYEALGLARMDNCQYAAALDSFQRAMEMVPARKHLREPIAFCHICLEDYEVAKDLLIDVLRDNPEDVAAYMSLAQCYIYVGHSFIFPHPNNGMVKKLLSRILEIEPDHCIAHLELASIAHEEKCVEEALAHYERVLQVWPGSVWVHHMRVTSYLEENRYSEASQAFDDMLKNADASEPGYADLLEELKQCFSMVRTVIA
jgi:tetratricopeptide (TPR) repeat protein